MADRLGVSPLTLRKSLAVLRSKGLLETRRGRGGGSYVTGTLRRMLGLEEHQKEGAHYLHALWFGFAACLSAS